MSLYDRYYRPERTTLVMVGDFDVDGDGGRRSRAKFGDWAGRGEAGAEPDMTYALGERGMEASVFVHKDGGDSISVYSLIAVSQADGHWRAAAAGQSADVRDRRAEPAAGADGELGRAAVSQRGAVDRRHAGDGGGRRRHL